MFDAALTLQGFLPAAGAVALISALDLGVDVTAFSDNWRQGRLRVVWPALPNHTNPALNITLTLVDSADGGATFQSGALGTVGLLPVIQIQIAGAPGGVVAGFADIPMPPGLRGPIGLSLAVPAGTGDNTQSQICARWGNN
jgi:hypothetical protein